MSVGAPLGIAGVLRSLADSALDHRQKGDRLEELTQKVMREAGLYAERYDEVHLWKDWPGRDGRPDTGIDLVARQRDGGGWTAVQCKFYGLDHKVAKGTSTRSSPPRGGRSSPSG